MSESRRSRELLIALIGVLGVIVAALIGNWHELFNGKNLKKENTRKEEGQGQERPNDSQPSKAVPEALDKAIESLLSLDHMPGGNLPAAGMWVRDIPHSDEYFELRNLPDLNGGVEVMRVLKGGPAFNAGIRAGQIIRKCDSIHLSSAEAFTKQVSSLNVGDPITVEVWSSSGPATREIELANGLTMYRESCNSRDLDSCELLAEIYKAAAGDNGLPAAINLFDIACSNEHAVSCSSLARSYLEGTGVERDLEVAFVFYKKSCDLGFGPGCPHAALMYETGEGARQNSNKSIEYYEKGCQQLDGWSCNDLGAIYAEGILVERDLPKALLLYGDACKSGHDTGCDNFKILSNSIQQQVDPQP